MHIHVAKKTLFSDNLGMNSLTDYNLLRHFYCFIFLSINDAIIEIVVDNKI